MGTGAHELLIAITSASGKEMKRFVYLCQVTKLPFKVTPSYGEILDGDISVKAIRDISFNDILAGKRSILSNNIFATQLLIEAAIIYQVERFVLVSTR